MTRRPPAVPPRKPHAGMASLSASLAELERTDPTVRAAAEAYDAMSAKIRAMPRYQIGDRVMRRTDVYNQASALLRGRVTERYSQRDSIGYYPELYAVAWDGGDEARGFLPHGLDPEVSP